MIDLWPLLLFIVLFFAVSLFQHLLVSFLYRRIFIHLRDVPYGMIFDRATVFFHEIAGHLLPGILIGSRPQGMDLGEFEGKVSMRFSKNMFGLFAVFITGFGPTFVLPFAFFIAWCLLYGHPLTYVLSPTFNLFQTLLSDLFALDPRSVLLIYLATVLGPGAASSKGDWKGMIKFTKENTVMVFVFALASLGILYLFTDMGFPLVDYLTRALLTLLGTFAVIFSVACLVLYYVVRSRSHWALGVGLLIMIIYHLLGLPYPLLILFVVADAIVLGQNMGKG